MKKRVGWAIIVIAAICLLLTAIGSGKPGVSQLTTIGSTVLSVLTIIVGLLQIEPALLNGLSRLNLQWLQSLLKKPGGIGPILVLLLLLVSLNTLLVLYKSAPSQPQGTMTSSSAGAPTASTAPVGTSSSQPLLQQPLHIDCATCAGPLSIGADLVGVTINSSSAPATTLLAFSFYNTLTQPAMGLHFTSIQLLDSTTGAIYKGIDTNRWDMAGQQQVPQIVQFQFVIQRGRAYTLSMVLADAQGNSLPYVSKEFSL